jgi:phosphoglucosamine mutase
LKKYFGTDGIRGIPNENLTQDLISGMARAVEQVLGISSVAVIQDTRSSSKEILDWISKGFSEEVNVFNYGVLPSGSMPILISEFNHDLGIIISASHNPSEYNGVKLINKNGSKLSDELEIAIESEIGKSDLPNSSSVVKETEEGKKAYEQFLLDQIDFNIDNFNLVIDCANGSAYQVIEELFKSNKNIRVINNTPDGENINHECGATYMENMVQNIKKGEIGISFDGDADRSILIDEEG